jgi:tetratricopeptide (TPR) repeat protein
MRWRVNSFSAFQTAAVLMLSVLSSIAIPRSSKSSDLQSSSLSQQQTLFGKRFEPYSEARRDKAFADLQRGRTDRARKIYDTRNGMLANELQIQMSSYTADLAERTSALEEWLAVYPKIPSGSQRFLARHALYIAREKKSNEIVSKVLAAALKNNWFPYPDLTKELELLSSNASLNQSIRDKARLALSKKPLEVDAKFDALLRTAEELVESSRGIARVEIQKLDYKECRLSWEPKFIKGITDADGRLKEHVAQYPKSLSIVVFPEVESKELIDSLNSLTDLYPNLPPESQEIFAARLFALTERLQASNLQVAADTLFWEVYKSLDSTWLEQNDIETKLSSNAGFYVNTGDLAKAEKIYLKVVGIEDLHYGGIPSNDNLRWVLGDLYDRMGNYDESRKQYAIAKEIDERLVRTSIVEANNFMDRDYEIRVGTYKSPYTSDKPLE